MVEFSYKSLPSIRSIRLIRFLPGSGPICQLITVEVEKAPPYVALSYTWGSKELARVISVNGAELPITVNLAEAIDAIYTFARERRLMFWADSICINQADLEERSSQVRLMNRIYRLAENVVVWLGPTADDSDLAFDNMKVWKEKLESSLKRPDGPECFDITISDTDSFNFGPSDSEQERALEAFRMVCRRSWWRRAWIVQEGTINCLARTIMFCGNRNVDWTYIRAAFIITEHNDDMAVWLDGFRRGREQGINLQLLRVLRFVQACECEDPRDKIYAARGMAMDVNEGDIVPDYTKSLSEVYIDVVNFCISKSNRQSLDFLGMIWRSVPGTAFENHHEATLPSWVPSWSFRRSLHPFAKVLDAYTYEEGKFAYNADGMLKGHCYIDGVHLCLQGSIIDHIVRVSSISDGSLDDIELDIEQSWAPESPNEQYLTGGTLMEAFNHTIVADLGRPNLVYASSRGFAVDWNLITQSVEEDPRQIWMRTDIKMMTIGRRMFETSRGFIGLGPAAACTGDQICVLLGGQVLYVLRYRTDGHHEFVGECYVHGMMDGQACQDESFCVRDIVLV